VAFDPKTRRVRFSDGVDREIRRVGHIDLPRGTPRRVVLNNGFAYVAHGAGSPSSHIVIVDVRRPDQPQVVSTLGLDWQPADLEVRAGVAYVPDGIGLHVVDVKDPAAPRVIAHYTQELGPRHGEARCVAIQNHILYLASAYRGVDALDVSDPAAPKLVGSWSSPGLASPTDLLVRGSCLWLASSEGIQILDVSKPSQPKAVQESRPARPKSNTEDGLLDAEDGGDAPAKGVTLKAYREIRNALRLALEEEYLYVVDKNRGLLILDISDPFSPDAVGRYEPKAGKEVKGREVHATSVIVNQQTAYLTVNCGQIPQMLDGEEKPVPVDAGGGLHILNAGDPLEPFLMGRWLPAGTMVDLIDVAIQGSVAVVADASYGLWTVDVSDPRQPSKLGEAPTQGDVRDLAMEGRMAYLASGGGQGILAVDLANPERPQIIGRYHTGFDAPSLAVKEGVVYTGSPDWSLPIGLQVIDFRDPARPERREVLSASAASQWSEHEGLLYASSGEVFDLTDPFRPMAYGKLPAGALYRSGPVFCVASPNMLYGLSIIDTSQDLREKGPARLRLFLDSSGRTGIIRRGDVLFLTGGPQGVAVVSLRNPESPQLLKMLRGNLGAATDVCVWGTALGIVDAYAGLQIYDAVDPARPRLRAVYPARGDNVSPSGSRCIAKDGLLFRTRGNGIDILEPPIPSEAPLGEVRPGAP
jgi:hypothetical protein